MKTSEVLRDALAKVRASPLPMTHRTYTREHPTGLTKAQMIARLEADIAYFAEQEAHEDLRYSPTRVQIRPGEYRGERGYLVTATYERGFPAARVFVRREATAKHVRDALKRGDRRALDEAVRSEGRTA